MSCNRTRKHTHFPSKMSLKKLTVQQTVGLCLVDPKQLRRWGDEIYDQYEIGQILQKKYWHRFVL